MEFYVNLLLQSCRSVSSDLSLRIESFAIIHLRSVSTNLNYYTYFAVQWVTRQLIINQRKCFTLSRSKWTIASTTLAICLFFSRITKRIYVKRFNLKKRGFQRLGWNDKIILRILFMKYDFQTLCHLILYTGAALFLAEASDNR